MRLMFLCPHFEPDLHAATGEVVTRLVHALAERGHRVDVVTSLPWYRLHDVEPEWRGRPWRKGTTDAGDIIRIWPFPTNKSNVPARGAAFAGFTALATGAALTLGRPDAVLAMSPPIFLGNAASVVARRWRVPLVFNVQDIFPDVAVEIGALRNQRVIDMAAKLERSLYRRADAVTVLSQDQADNVAGKLPAAQRNKVHIIENFVDLERVRPTERDNAWRSARGLTGKTIVMYAGNVGLSQPFTMIAAAADAFSTRPDVHFVINGEGAARPEVDRWAAPKDNVSVFDFVERDKVSDLLGAADVHVILLKAGLARSSTPSKLYGILAAGRPVVASIDRGSEVETVLQRADAGIVVDPENTEQFINALTIMLDDPEQRRQMGARAAAHVDTLMTPARQAQAYEQLFASLLNAGPRPHRDPMLEHDPASGVNGDATVESQPTPDSLSSASLRAKRTAMLARRRRIRPSPRRGVQLHADRRTPNA